MLAAPMIDRAFTRIREGQVHLRRADAAGPGLRPLYLVHLSPNSSRMLVPLMNALREAGHAAELIAPDTLGNGDSAAPPQDVPEIADLADAHVRTMDALGLDTVDLYGTHTGARIACEIAAVHPDRVARVILDGIIDYPDEMKRSILDNYAPAMEPDEYGRHLIWAFNYVRDQNFYFPHFLRDPEHRINRLTFPTPEQLHDNVLELLKALTTYHKPYLAAFRYPASQRLPLVRAPTAVLRADNEQPMLNAVAEEMAALLPDGRTLGTRGGVAGKAAAIATFLA